MKGRPPTRNEEQLVKASARERTSYLLIRGIIPKYVNTVEPDIQCDTKRSASEERRGKGGYLNRIRKKFYLSDENRGLNIPAIIEEVKCYRLRRRNNRPTRRAIKIRNIEINASCDMAKRKETSSFKLIMRATLPLNNLPILLVITVASAERSERLIRSCTAPPSAAARRVLRRNTPTHTWLSRMF
ncbi:hypothetical protein EVAR_65614_1 [Eumeta japonica]|uniref:Uncharacterized protein n=1 Tax=Eumeta variegata TaxID=151549 RepID=A0A4C1ZAW0_EUMVA|nr:hypothetical protein EVAR_65614_1 [Eumeta japonica]